MSKNILFIAAEKALPGDLLEGLPAKGYSPRHLLHSAAVVASLQEFTPQLIVIDGAADDTEILKLVRQARRQTGDCPVVVLVASGQSGLAGEAMRLGAIDYLLKPFTPEQFEMMAEHVISLHRPTPNLVYASHASRQLLLLAKKAAQTSASVMITGESGTGKERLARYIHDMSPRAEQPFVAVNCAAIPDTMLEATLFGHTKGAFTGASQSQPGKFELANAGTLLLDEIAELPLELQAKLLRVLQERELERLGSHQKIKLDVRIIAATNKDLRQQMEQGLFREDLFYRLDVLPLRWPALRERSEDILPLVRHFLNKYSPDHHVEIDPDAARALVCYPWPGNVRELENVIQRALIMARGLILRVEDLLLPRTAPVESAAVQELAPGRRGAEFQYVLDTLRRFNGHRTRTANALGVTTRALRYKLAAMREHGIDVNQFIVGHGGF